MKYGKETIATLILLFHSCVFAQNIAGGMGPRISQSNPKGIELPRYEMGFEVVFQNTLVPAEKPRRYVLESSKDGLYHFRFFHPSGKDSLIRIREHNLLVQNVEGKSVVLVRYRWPLVAGDSWSGREELYIGGQPSNYQYTVTVGNREVITVPAGKFDVYPVRTRSRVSQCCGGYSWVGEELRMYSPEVGWHVHHHQINYTPTGRIHSEVKYELLSYKKGSLGINSGE